MKYVFTKQLNKQPPCLTILTQTPPLGLYICEVNSNIFVVLVILATLNCFLEQKCILLYRCVYGNLFLGKMTLTDRSLEIAEIAFRHSVFFILKMLLHCVLSVLYPSECDSKSDL